MLNVTRGWQHRLLQTKQNNKDANFQACHQDTPISASLLGTLSLAIFPLAKLLMEQALA